MTFRKLIQPTKEHSCYNSSQRAVLMLAEFATYNPVPTLPGIFVLKMKQAKPK